MDAISYSLAAKAVKRLENKVNLNGNAVSIPVGGNADRPVLGSGDRAIRFNNDIDGLEEWNGVEWKNVSADISAVSIKGTDTDENILALVDMVAGDLWIASDTLDGWIYNGIVWINLGPLKGPQGVQGLKGDKGDKGDIGDIGPQGPQGIQGIQGIQGDIGPQGIQGPQGEIGPQGPIGETGAGLVVKGTDTVANILMKTGIEGDFWIAGDSGDGYSYVAGTWINTGQVRGPQGEQGIQGIQGEQGIQGPVGNGIKLVTKTNTVGLVDTYTVTMTNGSTSTFTVTNGIDGIDVDHISKTSGTGASGTTDVYTVWGDVAETISLGTFNVYNGKDGTGAIIDTAITTTTLWSSKKINDELLALSIALG